MASRIFIFFTEKTRFYSRRKKEEGRRKKEEAIISRVSAIKHVLMVEVAIISKIITFLS